MKRIFVAAMLVGLMGVAFGAELSVQRVEKTGTSVTMNDANDSGDDWFFNDGRTIVYAENETGGTTATVTVVTGSTVDGYAVANQSVTVNPGARVAIGPLRPAVFNDATSNSVTLTYSSASSVTVGVLRVVGY